MSDRCEGCTGLTQEFQLFPDLPNAISEWYEARHRFPDDPHRQYQDAYMKATDELGQALSLWKADRPGLFQQLRLWLYPEDERHRIVHLTSGFLQLTRSRL